MKRLFPRPSIMLGYPAWPTDRDHVGDADDTVFAKSATTLSQCASMMAKAPRGGLAAKQKATKAELLRAVSHN
jgi:hypothetical protein